MVALDDTGSIPGAVLALQRFRLGFASENPTF
jgi:hypothetical protein